MPRKQVIRSGIMIAGLLGLTFIAGPARAAIISGTFSGVATTATDPGNALGLGSIAVPDDITGYFSFNDLAITGTTSVNNLTFTITDVTTGLTAAFADSAGSTYNVGAGTYQLTATGSDPNSSAASVTLNATSILAGLVEQTFTSGASDLSTGSVSGLSGVLNFSITSAQVDVMEPSSLSVMGLGMLGMVVAKRRKISTPSE
jgi:hypothetical protein